MFNQSIIPDNPHYVNFNILKSKVREFLSGANSSEQKNIQKFVEREAKAIYQNSIVKSRNIEEVVAFFNSYNHENRQSYEFEIIKDVISEIEKIDQRSNSEIRIYNKLSEVVDGFIMDCQEHNAQTPNYYNSKQYSDFYYNQVDEIAKMLAKKKDPQLIADLKKLNWSKEFDLFKKDFISLVIDKAKQELSSSPQTSNPTSANQQQFYSSPISADRKPESGQFLNSSPQTSNPTSVNQQQFYSSPISADRKPESEVFKKLFSDQDLIIFGWYKGLVESEENPSINKSRIITNLLKLISRNIDRISSHYNAVQYSDEDLQGLKEFKFAAKSHFSLDIRDVIKETVAMLEEFPYQPNQAHRQNQSIKFSDREKNFILALMGESKDNNKTNASKILLDVFNSIAPVRSARRLSQQKQTTQTRS